jgi:hypothetical protein
MYLYSLYLYIVRGFSFKFTDSNVVEEKTDFLTIQESEPVAGKI